MRLFDPDPARPEMRLCLMVAQSGPAGLWAPSAVASAELAVAEINRAGGILGRPLSVFTADCGASGAVAAQIARDSIDLQGAEAIIGMFPSYARREVADAIGQRLPFLYTPQFEGHEQSDRVITTGETTEELLGVALRVVAAKRRIRRVFLCGSNYRWPRESFAVARRIIAAMGAEVVGEAFQRLGDHDYDMVLGSIRDSGADTVIPMFLGLDSVAFNRAFAAEGLAGRVLRVIPGFDETMLYGLGPDDGENLFAAASYFAAHRSRNNGLYLESYHSHFGDHPPPTNAYGQSVYEGIYSLAALIKGGASTAPAALRRQLGAALPHRSARNGADLRPVGARAKVLVAEVDGYDMKVIAEQDAPASSIL